MYPPYPNPSKCVVSGFWVDKRQISVTEMAPVNLTSCQVPLVRSTGDASGPGQQSRAVGNQTETPRASISSQAELIASLRLGIADHRSALVAAGSRDLVGCEQSHGTGSEKAKTERKDADDTYG